MFLHLHLNEQNIYLLIKPFNEIYIRVRQSYCFGLSIASNLLSSGVNTINTEAFVDAIRTVYAGQMPEIKPEEANQILQDYFNKLQNERGKAAKEAGEQFLNDNKSKEGVVTLESGLQYKVISTGNGAIPKSSDTVKCHYEGRLINGAVFDSSIRRGEPAEFPVNGVIAGWVEALQLMPVGDDVVFTITANGGYALDYITVDGKVVYSNNDAENPFKDTWTLRTRP